MISVYEGGEKNMLMTQSLWIAFLALFLPLLLEASIKVDCVFSSSTANLKSEEHSLKEQYKPTGDLLDTIISQF